MFDALFEALFTYRPIVFQQGEFRFNVTSGSIVAAVVAAAVVAAAILTPDASPVTQTLMAGPMVGLYCISIGLAWLVGRKRRQPEAED